MQAEDIGKEDRLNDGRVRLDHKPQRIRTELPAGDLLVRYRTGVGAVPCFGVTDLAEVPPQGSNSHIQ